MNTAPTGPVTRCAKCGYDTAGPLAQCPECGTLPVPRCADCGYNVSGLIAQGGVARCPECGAFFDPATVRSLPDLPGFWTLAWVCVRPGAAYLAIILFLGLLIPRRADPWFFMLACMGPPLLMTVSLVTVLSYTTEHYVERTRWWVVFLMLFASLAVSAAVGIACSLGLGAR